MQRREVINIGRNGVFGGLFGNPVREKKVSEQYRTHFRYIMAKYPEQTQWLRQQLKSGAILHCPGCGVNSPTCHGRIIEQEIHAEQADSKGNEVEIVAAPAERKTWAQRLSEDDECESFGWRTWL